MTRVDKSLHEESIQHSCDKVSSRTHFLLSSRCGSIENFAELTPCIRCGSIENFAELTPCILNN